MKCAPWTTHRLLIVASAGVWATGAFAEDAGVNAIDPPIKDAIHLDDASLPDPVRVPGGTVAGAKAKDLCAEAEAKPSPPTTKLCDEAFADRRVLDAHRYEYECAFLVPTSLGGASTKRNVWIQPASEAHWKRELDREIRSRVCNCELSLVQAQKEIEGDWVSAYRRYVVPGDPPIRLAQPVYDPTTDPMRSRAVRGLSRDPAVLPADVPQSANPNGQQPIEASVMPNQSQSGGQTGGAGGGIGGAQGGRQSGERGIKPAASPGRTIGRLQARPAGVGRTIGRDQRRAAIRPVPNRP